MAKAASAIRVNLNGEEISPRTLLYEPETGRLALNEVECFGVSVALCDGPAVEISAPPAIEAVIRSMVDRRPMSRSIRASVGKPLEFWVDERQVTMPEWEELGGFDGTA